MNTKLSVCMIVKNEENNIGRCLDSIVGIADEIIVVDTGSTDNTKEISKRYNAKIYDFQWVDDFSKARNYSIEQATGDWILILDGDDKFERKDASKLISLINNEVSADVYIFNTICYIGDRAGNEKIMNVNLRLFKKIPELRYQGKIHESLKYKDSNIRIETSDITIYHYGYINSNIVEQNKRERNMRILVSQLKEDGDNPYFLFCMGNEYFALNDMDRALEYFLSAYEKCHIYDVYVPKLIIRIIMTYQSKRDYINALRYIDEALQKYPQYTDVEYIRGTIYHILGNFFKAVKCFEKCLDMGEPPSTLNFIIGVGTYRAYYAIGSIHHQLNEFDDALKNYNQAILIKNDYYNAIYGIGNIITKIYINPKDIKTNFEQFFDMGNKGNIILMSDIMFIEKKYEIALEYIDKVLEIEPYQYDLILLKARCLYNLKKYDEAIEIFEQINKESPYYLNSLTTLCICYFIKNSYDRAESVLEKIKDISNEGKLYEVLICLKKIMSVNEKIILSENLLESNMYMPIIFEILDILLCANELDKFERSLELLNCINNTDVLLELAKLYNKYGYKEMAVKEIKRSIKIYDKIDPQTAFILYKNLNTMVTKL